MEFITLSKAEPNGIQAYLADDAIATEAAAESATANRGDLKKNGNILTDKSLANSYTYQNGWKKVVGGGGGSSYTAGAGIDISNDTISAKVDGSTITTNASGQLVASGGSGVNFPQGNIYDLNYTETITYAEDSPLSLFCGQLDEFSEYGMAILQQCGLYVVDGLITVEYNIPQSIEGFGGISYMGGGYMFIYSGAETFKKLIINKTQNSVIGITQNNIEISFTKNPATDEEKIWGLFYYCIGGSSSQAGVEATITYNVKCINLPRYLFNAKLEESSIEDGIQITFDGVGANNFSRIRFVMQRNNPEIGLEYIRFNGWHKNPENLYYQTTAYLTGNDQKTGEFLILDMPTNGNTLDIKMCEGAEESLLEGGFQCKDIMVYNSYANYFPLSQIASNYVDIEKLWIFHDDIPEGSAFVFVGAMVY